jgi:hypothetical protein
MAKAHDRIIEFNITLNAAADTLAVDSVKYYRDRGQLDANNGYTLAISGGSAAVSPKEVSLGETMPPPTHARFKFTAF